MTYQEKTAIGAGIPDSGHNEHLAKNADLIISLESLECNSVHDAGYVMIALGEKHFVACHKYRAKVGIKLTDPDAYQAIGCIALGRITDCGGQRFEFAKQGEAACIAEVLDRDGETPIDVVAWPIADPGRIMTLFGRAALLGNFNAYNPASYYMDHKLPIWRTPLEMMQNRFRGACIINEARAGDALRTLPGDVAVMDPQLGRHIERLRDSQRKPRVFVPAQEAHA